MLTVCYAIKGGSGTTVVAAALALSAGSDTLLIDLGGDLPALFAIQSGDSPGITDWLDADADVDAAAIEDLGHRVSDHLTVVARGSGPLPPVSERWSTLATWLAGRQGPTIVDAGTGEPSPALAAAAGALLLVTRPCYLAIARAARSAAAPTGVVVVDESGRALGRRDVAAALGIPVLARIPFDPKLARAVDAGMLACSVPRGLGRRLRKLAA